MVRRALFTLACLAAFSALPGCVFVKPYAICRVWADWNTYGTCSLCFEKLEHNPYRRQEVEVTRWRYGARPVSTRHCGDSGEGCPNANCPTGSSHEPTPAPPVPAVNGQEPHPIAPPQSDGVAPIPNVVPRHDSLPPPPEPHSGAASNRNPASAIDRTAGSTGPRASASDQKGSRAANALWLFTPAQ